MNAGLFECLTGHYSDGSPVESVPESSRQIKSIMDHLSRLFNTRSGSIPHLEDYGLPDLSEFYRSMAEREDLLRLSIKRAVEKYEPRLKNVQITPADIKDQKSRVSFILSGQMLNGRQVTFHTTLSTMEPSKVIQYKKPE